MYRVGNITIQYVIHYCIEAFTTQTPNINGDVELKELIAYET
jgi:hypothetical protein